MGLNRRQLVASGAAAVAAASPASAGLFKKRTVKGRGAIAGPTFFVLGAFLQQASSIPTWKARGINTMVNGGPDSSDGGSEDAGRLWLETVRDEGLYYMVAGRWDFDNGNDYVNNPNRMSTSNLYAEMQADPLCIACHLKDEPDLSGPWPISKLMSEVNFARGLGFTKPFFLNYTNNVIGRAYENLHPEQYVNAEAADWQSSDNYAYQGGVVYQMNILNNSTGPTSFTTMSGHATRTLIRGPLNKAPITRPNRATFQYLASGRVYDYDQNGDGKPEPWPRMTHVQHSVQAWSCIIQGVCGLIYFAHYFPHGQGVITDDTDRTMERSITDLAAKIAILATQPGGDVLMDAANGGRRPYTVRPSTKSIGGGEFNWPRDQVLVWAPTTGLELPPFFEGAEIAVGEETYRLVLNLHDSEAKTLTDARWDMKDAPFRAGEVKCFKASAPGVNLFAA